MRRQGFHDPRLAPGGSGVRPDPDLFDPNFPEMERWASAGVRGGLVPAESLGIKFSVTSSQSVREIQAVIDEASAASGGVATVLFEAGTYLLDEPLRLRSNVLLRGASYESTFLNIVIRNTWNLSWLPEPFFPAGIEADGVVGGGIENLTIQYDSSLPESKNLRNGDRTFDDDPEKDNPYYVQSVVFKGCKDCWIQACRILDAGSSPLVFVRSEHCTARWCEIVGARNKHGGMAYVNLSRSTSCLLTGLWVRDIRHVGIQNEEPAYRSDYNVIYDCDLEVDVNFHNGDSGRNLIQDNRIAIPSWHWWGPFAVGVDGRHLPPGERNILYRNDAYRRRVTPYVIQVPCPDLSLAYEMNSTYGAKIRPVGTPADETLYAIRSQI